MSDESGPVSRACQRCGVAVPPGYVKCPRCHADLPLAIASRRPLTDGGGTAVEGGPDRRVLYAAGAAVVAIGILVWALSSGGEPPAPAPAPTEGSAEDDDDSAATEPDEAPVTEAPPDRPPSPPVNPSPGADAPAAAAALGRALRAERMWASVTAVGNTVVIDSSLCDDTGLTSIVDASAGDLRAARFTQVRCRAPHGAIVFEHGL